MVLASVAGPLPDGDLPEWVCASERVPWAGEPFPPVREFADDGHAPVVAVAELDAMAVRGDPYRRGAPSAVAPCGADPSAADSSGAFLRRDRRGDFSKYGRVAAARPHGRADADRLTNEIGNDGDGVHPSNNRSRILRSNCSRMEIGSSSEAATVVAWGVPLVAATVTSGEQELRLVEAVAIR